MPSPPVRTSAEPPRSPVLTRLVSLLAPVVVLGGVAFVVIRALPSGDPALAREQAALSARLGDKSGRKALVSDLRDFALLRRSHDGATDFAVESFARLHALKDLIETWTADADRATRPGAAKAFARTALQLLGHDTDNPSEPVWMLPRCLQALAEAGEPTARDELRAFIATMNPEWTLAVYAPMHRTPTVARDITVEAMETRKDAPLMVAAAAAMRTYPGDRRDVPAMRPIVSSNTTGRMFFWRHLVRALGNGGAPEDAAFLAAERGKLTGDTREEISQRLALDVGLALAGDAAAADRVRAAITPADDSDAVNWAIGLSTRLAHGDRTAIPTLVDLWSRGGDTTRLLIGLAVLLADPAPPDELPCDAWAEGLAKGPNLTSHAIGHAWQFRRGKNGALDALIEDLRQAARTIDPPATSTTVRIETDESSCFLEVLRAFVRWG
jgi:hypothetical protein